MSLKKLHPRLQDYVADKKWGDLTDIQKAAFDPIFNGESCIIEAPTSGGKTEAVLFPLLTRIATNNKNGFKVLYIAPLKALLNDLALRVIPYAERCGLKAFKWHGDVGQAEKIQQMVFPADILLTTPESIEAILLRKANWQDVFTELESIVIDEAHYFALTERGAHLMSLLERITVGINKDPQRIAVTATIGNPQELAQWMMGSRKAGKEIKVARWNEKERDFMIHYFMEESAGLQDKLYDLLIRKKSIVFERSRSGTEETASKISQRNQQSGTRNPIIVKTHHSSVSKKLREEAEGGIKQHNESSVNAIISTSTLELGIDIGELDQVVQVGGLNSSGSFLQRVGRTGRRANQPQYFRGLCEEDDELLLLAGCVNLGWRHESENILFPHLAFHILAHQTICLCLQLHGATADTIWSTLSKASCFSAITKQDFIDLISYMKAEDFLREIGGGILLISNKTEDEFLRANWKRLFAIFDTGPMYNVVDGKRIIGTLDSNFARGRELPFVFVLGGQEWNALKIDHEMQQVLVKKNTTGIPPKWKAICNFDVPFELAQEVGRLLKTGFDLPFLDHNAKVVLQKKHETYFELGWAPDKWIVETSPDFPQIYLWTFAGDKINRAIAALLFQTIGSKPEHDYKKITIVTDEESEINYADIQLYLNQWKSRTAVELEQTINSTIKVSWFSKFSECLPPLLAKKVIVEKGFDFKGLNRELNKVIVE